MKLDVRVPISPEPHFFRQVEYLWRSFVAAGGHTATARFTVSVGADCEPYDIAEQQPWSRGHVTWRWVDRELFRAHLPSYNAATADGFAHETDADIVMLADADTLLVRGIDDVLDALAAEPAVAGVMAYVPPFVTLRGSGITWRDVFAAAGRELPPDRYQHSGWGSHYWGGVTDPTQRFGPAYLNFGAVFVPGPVFAALGREWERQLPVAARTPIEPRFAAQVALTFAIYELGLPRLVLPPRYNFPNDEHWADLTLLSDLADVRIVHYFMEHIIGARRDTWADDARFAPFLERTDLTGSNEVLRSTAASLSSRA